MSTPFFAKKVTTPIVVKTGVRAGTAAREELAKGRESQLK